MIDYYELLEVNKNASEETIKKVFRMLIKKNHPDLFEGDEKLKAEEKVKSLNEAYAVLSDKEKREKYNSELEESNVTIETLLKENEYLKSVIQEKNNLIKEYLDAIGVNTSNYTNEFSEQYEAESEEIKREDNNSYNFLQRVKNIIYMLIMIFIAIVAIKLFIGVDIVQIFTDIFKTMF